MEREPRQDRRPEGRRVLVVVAFVALSVALALVLAFLYSMPFAGY